MAMDVLETKYASSAVLLALAALAVGCTPPEKPSDAQAGKLQVEVDSFHDLEDGQAVVARVGGEEITREEFDRRIRGLADFARLRLQSAAQREDFLARIVEFEVMADEAERRGYGDHVRVRHAMKEAMVQIMVEEWLRSEVSIAELDEEQRQAYYEEFREEFVEPEQRRVARIVVDSEERGLHLVERLPEAAERAEDGLGNRFRRFAFKHSLERETGDQGGDAGWRTPGEVGAFGEDVFEWEREQVYGPFETEEGLWVLKMVVDIREEVEPGAEELEQEIVQRVYEERRQEARHRWIDELAAGADVQIWSERLDGLSAPSDEVPPRLEELPRHVVDSPAAVASEE